MSILNFISSIISPVKDIIDNLTTTDEERLKIKLELTKVENELAAKLIELETKLVEAQGEVIKAEAQGSSWLQRNWRPITMLIFVYIVANNYILAPTFGITTLPIPDDLWDLLKIGLGGYIVGRSAEKIATNLKKG